MRSSRPQVAFQVLLTLSIVAFLAGFFTAVHSADACDDRGGTYTPAKDCALSAAAEQTMANVIGLAGVGLMIGGIGFQIGRGAGAAMPVPSQGMHAQFGLGAPPQFPVHGGMSQPQGAPPQQGRQPDQGQSGQWGQPAG